VTVGQIHGGVADNVIPESVEITGTYRSLSSEGLEHTKTRIKEVSKKFISNLNRCKVRPHLTLRYYHVYE